MKSIFIGILSSLFFSLYGGEIAVVTLAVGTDYINTVQQGIDNKRLYCKKHGYDFIYCDTILDHTRPIPWSKIQILLKTMENTEYKWIFWTDADSLVMNHTIPLESLIDDNYNFIISRDPNAINSGQFLIKNCAWSRQFLQNVYAHTECINHCWWENQAIILEYNQNPDVANQTKLIPQRSINSYPKEVGFSNIDTLYQPGDFIIHFPGIHNGPWLLSLFNKYATLSIDDATLPLVDSWARRSDRRTRN